MDQFEIELKKKLELEYSERLKIAIDYKEKEFKVKHMKMLDQEKVNIEKNLKDKYVDEIKDEWNKIENEKAEIARQKAAHSIRLENFAKQKKELEERENKINKKQELQGIKVDKQQPMNYRYQYEGKLLMGMDPNLLKKTLNNMLIENK